MLHSKLIGNKIVEARKKVGLSQAELAQKISISPQAVGKWERGESMPDILTLSRLAEILGVDLNHFSLRHHPETLELTNTPPITKEELATAPVKTNKNLNWNWDMSRGNWLNADFSGLKNLKETFSSSNMKNCKFMNSDLSGLVLGKNNIQECDFTESDLRASKIQSSNLLNNQFTRCSFIDVELVKNNISNCNFTGANFSGAEFLEGNFENNSLVNSVWKFTSFINTCLSKIVFEGTLEDCHFENCAFYDVTFNNSNILNTFFNYNKKFKKVKFVNCKVDKLTYAFIKNNQANLTGITIIE